jgi:hypothetical protein
MGSPHLNLGSYGLIQSHSKNCSHFHVDQMALVNIAFTLNVRYWECVSLIRRMYHDSELVHADLCSYNLLVHEGRLVVIDLAQVLDQLNPFVIPTTDIAL